MADATISGSSGENKATVTNATDGTGKPSTNSSDVTVNVDNATLSGSGTFMDVNFYSGRDTLVGENVPYVNDPNVEIGFDQIEMGSGDDLVDLTRSGFREIDMGSGDDTLALTNSGGQSADLGSDNDRLELDLSEASSQSEQELSQKVGEPPTSIDGGSGDDTLNLIGDWSLTLSSGNFTLDTDNNGSGDLVTNTLAAEDYTKVVGFPALLNGTVQWDGTVTLSSGDTVVSQATFRNFEDLEAVCFTSGTLIDTPDGKVAIETLKEGDLVCTRQGTRPVRWVGKRRLDVIDLMANPKLLPIRVPAGAFGSNLPERDISFSPQHRLVVRSVIVERMFNETEVLVPAKLLVGCDGIDVDGDVREVTYIHIMLDEHAVVQVEGLEAETLFPGPMALDTLSQDALTELRTIFPDFDDMISGERLPKGAMTFATSREGRALAARHAKNRKPLYCTRRQSEFVS